MDFQSPTTWADALAAKAEHPDAVPVSGGTDVMVEINFGHRTPPRLLDLTRVPELSTWDRDGDRIRLGAGVTYARLITELAGELPGLATAARTVGSPQIRNRGTVGGNLGAASPAGDSHPPLLATGAEVELASVRGGRRVPVAEFYTGPKRSVLAADELIAAVHVPVATGPQQFCKVGTRNAMVISVTAFALALHPQSRTVGTGIGSAAPTPRPATDAAAFLAAELDWDSGAPVGQDLLHEFGRRVRDAAAPIDDVRGSAAYRLHALAVLARRALTWAWDEYRTTDTRSAA
jgi:CO/xanthine dehydrogenase FAD-binding subunit